MSKTTIEVEYEPRSTPISRTMITSFAMVEHDFSPMLLAQWYGCIRLSERGSLTNIYCDGGGIYMVQTELVLYPLPEIYHEKVSETT